MEYDIREGRFTFKHALDTFESKEEIVFADHFHTEYEFVYMLRGDAFFVFKDRRYRMTHRCLQVAKPGEFHHIEVAPEIPYERIVIRFAAGDIPQNLREKLNNLAPLYSVISPELTEEVLSLDKLFQKLPEDMQMTGFISALNIIIAYLVSDKEPIKSHYDSNQNLKNILSYIEAHLTEIHSVDSICKGLYMSKTTLNQLFSHHLGTSVMDYVRTQKCVLANSLLSNGFKASDIYSTCGFNDYSSFYRSYVKIYKESPSRQYR